MQWLAKPAIITGFWSLLNISSKQIQWVLKKAVPTITLSKQSITLDSDNLTDTFSITTNSDGNLSVISSDDLIATVSLSGNTATVEALANGTCTITVNVAENSNYLNGNAPLPVNASFASTALNDNSWATISNISRAGTASNYWSVGDTKEVILNGNTASTQYNYNTDLWENVTKSFNDYSCYATILGFDHNASLETNSKHSIHFILGKDSTGKDISFCYYKMNEDNVTDGGWNGSKMKQTTMVEFKNILPSDLQTVLKNVTKYTHNTTGGSGNQSASNVTATTEQVFLLSEFEVKGTRRYANKYEQNKQDQYAYYANGNSVVRYPDTNDEYISWLLRSAYCYDTYTTWFCCVYSNGVVTNNSANIGRGIAPAFVV